MSIKSSPQDMVRGYPDKKSARRFDEAEDVELKQWVVRALFNKGLSYGRQMNREEANAAYDEIITRFETAEDPELKDMVGRAKFNKGVSYHF